MKRVLALAVLFVVPAFAQTTPQQQPSIDAQIVVTASSLPETLLATPAAVTVITRKEIDDRAARDVADLLREVPGLVLARSGSPGKATSLFTRGAASTQTLVLWNGITLNNPYFSGYDWGRFSTAGVEQIEVVRGPFSALYGSEAMAGVVNVLTTPRTSGVHGDFERWQPRAEEWFSQRCVRRRYRHSRGQLRASPGRRFQSERRLPPEQRQRHGQVVAARCALARRFRAPHLLRPRHSLQYQRRREQRSCPASIAARTERRRRSRFR